MDKWVKKAVVADRFALPFWIILIIYGVYEVGDGNFLGLIPLIIGVGALVIDTIFVLENRKIK
tara:strand:+ start:81 stop:269 length:189 start_codon:yes stop_codon:yes gene_type:complete